MKKLILAAVTTTCALSVFAQGTVSFANRSAGGTTHVWVGGSTQLQGLGSNDGPTPGSVDFAGAGAHLVGTLPGGLTEAQHIWSQLLGGPAGSSEASLLPSSLPPSTFRTGAASGNVALNTATFANIALDAPSATFEMVAWDNTTGLYPTWAQASVAWKNGLIMGGTSGLFNISSIGGGVNTPPNLNPGLPSFNIFSVPEPTSVALAGLGAAALLIFRRRK